MDENVNTRILKSTTIIGGSSALNIIFRILQSKIAAVLLGPQGVGLMGLFGSVAGLASTLTSLGIGTSGVREIARAVESGDQDDFGRTVLTYRRLTFVLGGIGALAVFTLRSWISFITFGSLDYASSIGWLSLVVFFSVVSTSQTALLQGVRRIGDLARVSVIGMAIGTLLGIPMLYWWGAKGVIFDLLGIAGMTILVSWWYARKVPVHRVLLTWRDALNSSRNLITLGIAFMGAGLATLATTYLVKVLITRQLGVEATGLYQAASVLAGVYVGFILSAMGADFFPHLSSVSHDNFSSNQLINAQAQIGTLLGIPGILFVFALGPWLLQLLYSIEFISAFDILRWLALGTFLRLISWPLGFLVLARGKGRLYLATEISSNLVFLGCAWFGLKYWGVVGVGVAFFILYVFYTALMTFVAGRLSGFFWTHESLVLFGWTLPVVVVGFVFSFIKPAQMASGVGFGLTLVVGVLALRTLRNLIGQDTFNSYVDRIRQKLPSSKV
jgi:enterobacterial common antigen flippase